MVGVGRHSLNLSLSHTHTHTHTTHAHTHSPSHSFFLSPHLPFSSWIGRKATRTVGDVKPARESRIIFFLSHGFAALQYSSTLQVH